MERRRIIVRCDCLSCVTWLELDMPCGDRTIRNLQLTDTDGQPKTTGTGASWIDVEDSIACLARRTMRVPKYYDTEARRRRIEVKFRDVVENIDGDIVNLEHLGLSDSIGPWAFVVVATHDGDRS